MLQAQEQASASRRRTTSRRQGNNRVIQYAQELERGCPPEWPDNAVLESSAHEQPPSDWDAGAPPGREWVPQWGCPPLWEVPQARRRAAHLVANEFCAFRRAE